MGEGFWSSYLKFEIIFIEDTLRQSVFNNGVRQISVAAFVVFVHVLAVEVVKINRMLLFTPFADGIAESQGFLYRFEFVHNS